MNWIKSITRYWFLIFIISSFSCGNGAGTKASDVLKDSSPVNAQQNADSTNANNNAQSDSLLFISAFHRFGESLQSKNMDSLNSLIHFPLYGTAPFTGNYEKEEQGIDSVQLDKYYDKIFDRKIRSFLADRTFDQFSMYHKEDFFDLFDDSSMIEKVWNNLDKNSPVGVAYIQYALPDGKETNQSYLFGKIKNRYQLVALAYRNNL